ncbi:MAG: class I SAM-dependent methyltransferase [Tessaracoccus sp.]|nr:class I SAM-dependent methyltransferase [Tessaracoccus sp.]
MREPDPSSLGAGERLRRSFGADDAAWALGQAVLRRRAAAKFERADEMLFTRNGLEQATRRSVARWRAQRFADAGVTEVWDLGCGIGADAMAFLEAGLRVVAVDADPETAAVAAHNLALVAGAPGFSRTRSPDCLAAGLTYDVHVGLAEEQTPPPGAAIFLDPARRTARGRTWNVADFTPSWDFVLAQLSSDRFVCVKLGPGVPKEIIPYGVQAAWVSESHDVVEASLWNRLSEGPAVVALGAGGATTLARTGGRPGLDVRPLGRYLIEPDGAVIRAGLFEEIAPAHDLWLLDPHIAYLSSDEPLASPLATCFAVREVLDYDRRTLRRWVAEHGIGTLEIKKRGIDVDPAALRRELKPKGTASATLVLARTLEGTKAVVVERLSFLEPRPRSEAT